MCTDGTSTPPSTGEPVKDYNIFTGEGFVDMASPAFRTWALRNPAEAARVLMPHGWLLGDVPTFFGKWGYRSLRGHKWHKNALTETRLRSMLGRQFNVETVSYRRGDWRSGYVLPQWMSFKCRKIQ